jgi:hypothetical protein
VTEWSLAERLSVSSIDEWPSLSDFDDDGDERVPAAAAGPDDAARRLAELVSREAVDRMLADADAAGVPAEELLQQMTRAVLERALGVELDDHLGYVKGDPAGSGSGNSRNGHYGKTVTTAAGPVRIAVPRDRNSTFEPKIVPKGQRRLGQVDDMILSVYARGMTTRDIQAHLAEVYGAEVSPALISNVTDVVAEEITTWQTRPLDAVYPILYIDALVIKVRDGGTVPDRIAAPLIRAFRHGVILGQVKRVDDRKQQPCRDLLECLRDRQDDVLRFAGDLRIPPTSNQAEADLRPAKTQQKISGRLRSEQVTRHRYAIRGYIPTAAKHGASVLATLRDALTGQPWMPPVPDPP